MKKLLVFLFSISLLWSTAGFAERITCSYIFENEAKGFILERSTNNFLWQTTSDRNFTLEILYETKDILILGEFFDYGVTKAYFTLFFDKKTKKYRSGTTNNPSFHSDGESNTGACLVN
jgi:hypothetical protein